MMKATPPSATCQGARLEGIGVQHPMWHLYNESASPNPWSPQPSTRFQFGVLEYITLVTYGCSTLRVSAFPTMFLPAGKKP